MGYPAASYLSDNLRTEGEMKTAFEDQLKANKQVPGAGQAKQSLTIAAGSVTPALGSAQVLELDTEGAAATDDLTNIVTTNLGVNSLVLVKIANAGRVVTLKHAAGGTGQMSLKTGGDMTLGDTSHWILFFVNGTQLDEVARFPSEGPLVLSKSGNYTTTVADRAKLVDCTATLTLSLLAAASAGKGFEQSVQCSGGVATIDPNGGETIGGASTLVLQRGDKAMLVSDGTNWQVLTRSSAQVGPVKGAIQGFTYANNAIDATNDIDVAAGSAIDDTGAYLLSGSALTKRLDAAWAVGNNAGGLDTGAIGNNDYYIWGIVRPDSAVVDYLFSLSSTAPTMPANYIYKRLLGWFKRVGGAIVAMTTYETMGGGLELLWTTPTLDIDLANTLTTSRRTDAVKVPLNFSVMAKLIVRIEDAGNRAASVIYCPDQSDLTPSEGSGSLALPNIWSNSVTSPTVAQLDVRTSSTGLIAARSVLATVDRYSVSTLGFLWSRRN